MSLIVAVDDIKFEKAKDIISETCDLVAGYKIGLPYIIEEGIGSARLLKRECANKMWIADLKLADIGYVMNSIIRKLHGIFDYVISHSFIGVNGALDELSKKCKELGINLIVIATMSHKGAREAYDYMLIKIEDIVDKLEPWGLVAPATRKNIIRFLREVLGLDIPILSPGIGPQGALPGDALCAGATYEIVGRMIVLSARPRKTTEEILKLQREAVRRCKT